MAAGTAFLTSALSPAKKPPAARADHPIERSADDMAVSRPATGPNGPCMTATTRDIRDIAFIDVPVTTPYFSTSRRRSLVDLIRCSCAPRSARTFAMARALVRSVTARCAANFLSEAA